LSEACEEQNLSRRHAARPHDFIQHLRSKREQPEERVATAMHELTCAPGAQVVAR
jgi:hypothetical protein